MFSKLCKSCTTIKLCDEFRKHNTKKRSWIESQCLICEKEYNKKLNNSIDQKEKRKIYRLNNKETLNKYDRDRIKNDPVYKIRKRTSNMIRKNIKGNKNKKCCLLFLPYKIENLKIHIESQFESWMTWKNWGNYNTKWNDNDQSTWTWQIDHIIPQSVLPYINMEDDNFKKCWALTNLRPLSAKQNVTDGGTRARHKVV